MKNAFKNALAGFCIVAFVSLVLSVPYLLIAFQQLHIDFRLWSSCARTTFCLTGLIVFMMSIGILLNDDKKLMD
jgi:hypothetical protein